MDRVDVGDLVLHRTLGIGRVIAPRGGAALVRFVRDGRYIETEIVLTALEPAPRGATEPSPTSGTPAVARGQWNDDELIVLIVAFHRNEFAAGDDARVENRALARAFGRTPAAVDRQWRNVADIVEGKDVLHVGENVIRAVERYQRAPGLERERAIRIAIEHKWAVLELL